MEIDNLLENNRHFVTTEGSLNHNTDSGIPSKSVLLLACMDTRLSVMLPDALGIVNGECKVVKVAGGVVLDDYGSVMRSIIIGIYELGVREIMVIHHTDCGAGKMHGEHMLHLIHERISQQEIDEAALTVDLDQWLNGFGDTTNSVKATVRRIRKHPLVPHDVVVRGFIINSQTGELTEVEV